MKKTAPKQMVKNMPAPLKKWWGRYLVDTENSDNWRVFAFGAVLGIIIGILIATL
jgi:hypothetical protein